MELTWRTTNSNPIPYPNPEDMRSKRCNTIPDHIPDPNPNLNPNPNPDPDPDPIFNLKEMQSKKCATQDINFQMMENICMEVSIEE